jgi:pimeloyl-ACP methyl ester carboxylesterase
VQPCDNRYLLDYIAGHSLKESAHGFEFKVDQSLFAKMTEGTDVDLPDAVTMIRSIRCPAGLIYGDKSRLFPPEDRNHLISLFGNNRLANIGDAYHHVFLDQPLEFISALKTLLSRLKKART